MRILVAVIAYNEEKNITRALQDLLDHQKTLSFTYDIVVIDNGSTDRTAVVAAQSGVPVVSHCVNSGGSGGTVTCYFKYADFHNYDVLAQFDGDAQQLAAELPKTIDPILKGEADYVVGSRYLTGEGFQSTAARRIGIQIFNKITAFLTGVAVTDSTSGARAYSKKVIHFFARQYQYEILDPIQLRILSHYAGAKIIEVPVVMREREFGQSEFTFLSSIVFMMRGFANIVACFMQRRIVSLIS